MKKGFFVLIWICFTTSLFAQERVPKEKLDLLAKSRKQYKTGLILLGTGAALFTTGMLIPKGKVTGYNPWPLNPSYENDVIRNAFAAPGLTAMLISIPFFIASKKNKKRGNLVFIRNNHPVFPGGNQLQGKKSVQMKLMIPI